MLAGDSGWNFYWLSVVRIMEKFSVFSADEIVSLFLNALEQNGLLMVVI